MKFKCVSLIGLPACGKSKFSKDLIEFIKNNSKDSVSEIYNIEFDFITNQFNRNKEFNVENWKISRDEIYLQVLNILNRSNNLHFPTLLDPFQPILLNNNNDNDKIAIIILDDNMYYKSMRYSYYKLQSISNVKYCQVYFEKDLNQSIENNNLRNNNNNNNTLVPNEIIMKMNENLEVPNEYWEIDYTITTHTYNNNNKMDLNEIYKEMNKIWLLDNFKDEIEMEKEIKIQKEKDRAHTETNIIHQYDQKLRKIINTLFQTDKYKQLITPVSSKSISKFKNQFVQFDLPNLLKIFNDTIENNDKEEFILLNFKNHCINILENKI